MSHLKKLFAVGVLLVLGSLARAEASSSLEFCERRAQNLFQTFEAFYYDGYRPLMCSSNIKKWSEIYPEDEIARPGNLALVIHHKWWQAYPTEPTAARTVYQDKVYGTPRWGFHAIALIDGLVIDFDYTNQPTITGLNDYIAKMFATDKTAAYVIQTKPLVEFKGRDLYGFIDQTLFPEKPFAQAIESLQTQTCADYVPAEDPAAPAY